MPYTDDVRPWRRLACALLLSGALGAHAGDGDDAAWIAGPEARRLADLVGLPAWPPRPEQLASRRLLERRAAELNIESAAEPVGALSLRGRRRRW